MNISLRKATTEDIALLEYWDQQEHVIAADRNNRKMGEDDCFIYQLTREKWKYK